MNIYKFHLHFRVTRQFELPHFQGTALRNLLSGFKERQPALNSFFFETKLPHRQNLYSPYTLLPLRAGKALYQRGDTFSFELTVLGKYIEVFDNVLQLMCLRGFSICGGDTANKHAHSGVHTSNKQALSGVHTSNSHALSGAHTSNSHALSGVHTAKECLEIQAVENIISHTERKPIVAFDESEPYQFNTQQFNTKQLTINFVTPVCIKNNHRADDFTFDKLINTAAHRANAVVELFGNSKPDGFYDAQALSTLAKQVEIAQNHLKPFFVRHFTKSAVYKSFVGNIVYSGNFEPFAELLQLAELIHIGRGTTSGLGKFLMNSE